MRMMGKRRRSVGRRHYGHEQSASRRIPGSYFWLIFWTIVFFPIAIFYFVLASVTIEEEIDADKFLEWYRSRKKK